jgi:hypothetical protein
MGYGNTSLFPHLFVEFLMELFLYLLGEYFVEGYLFLAVWIPRD